MSFFDKITRPFKRVLKGVGDVFTGGAFSAADEAKKQARRLRREEALAQANDLAQRQAVSRASLSGRGGGDSPSLFDLLSRPS